MGHPPHFAGVVTSDGSPPTPEMAVPGLPEAYSEVHLVGERFSEAGLKSILQA